MALAFQRDISQPFPRSGLAHPFVSTAIILGRLLCNFLELRQQLFVGNPSFTMTATFGMAIQQIFTATQQDCPHEHRQYAFIVC